MIRSVLLLATCHLVQAASDAPAPPIVVKQQGFLPFGDAPIHYRTSRTLGDQITRLNRQLASGEARLEYEPEHGYLRSALKLLGVPVSSQTLVFSKTSLQFQQISPATPRALYFNDNVYVGQVLGGKSLELIAFDAQQGAVFYVLGERAPEHAREQPRFERAQLDCMQCHIATATRGIPGVMVRSVLTAPSGYPKGGAPVHTMGHETPFAQRWGGWYVTGAAAAGTHQGNPAAVSHGQNLASLSGVVDTRRFLSEHSDVVAHAVLAHQTQMHNLVTETNYRYRLGLHADQQKAQRENLSLPNEPSPETRLQYEKAAEATLRYLLFAGEAPLPGRLQGTSSFAADFAALGPRDRQGRSLRDFDLEQRVFKYPCSYLIYSDAFDAIPGPARDYLLRRLFEVLTGADQQPDFQHLTTADRRAIFEILVDTKPDLPAYWKQPLNLPHSQLSAPAATPAQPNPR